MKDCKLIGTPAGRILAVGGIPEHNFWLNKSLPNFLHVGDIAGDAYSIQLPSGNWKLLGRLSEIMEEQVEHLPTADYRGFANPVTAFYKMLLKEDIYIENQYEKPEQDKYMPGENFTRKQQDEYWNAERQFREARLFTNPIILIETYKSA